MAPDQARPGLAGRHGKAPRSSALRALRGLTRYTALPDWSAQHGHGVHECLDPVCMFCDLHQH